MGEERHFFWGSALPSLLSAMSCARSMQAQPGPMRARGSGSAAAGPVVLVTDHALLRGFAARGYFSGVVGALVRPPVLSTPGSIPSSSLIHPFRQP